MLDDYRDILSVSDAAEILSVGKGRIYGLLESGELKALRMGNIWKIPKKALENYIFENSKMA